jgi:Zn-dependent protease with chaperone function
MRPNDSGYRAAASHADLGDQEIAGRIFLNPTALLFESQTANFGIPLDRLRIQRDTSGRIQFTDLEQPDLAIYCADEQILKDFFFIQRYDLSRQIREVKQALEGRRNLRLAGFFLAAFAGVIVGVWCLTGWLIQLLVANIPLNWEVNLSNMAIEEIQGQLRVVHDPARQAKLTALGARLARSLPKSGYKFEIQVIENPHPTAFALPGGKVFVSSGLFEFVQKPEEIAGVLAHEIAHVTQRHGLRQIVAAAGPYYVLRLFISDKRGFMSLVSNGAQLLVQRSYSRELESEADRVAWGYLVAAKIDPRGLTEFLKRLNTNPLLARLERSSFQVFNTHPVTSERIQELEKLWAGTPHSGFVPLPEN